MSRRNPQKKTLAAKSLTLPDQMGLKAGSRGFGVWSLELGVWEFRSAWDCGGLYIEMQPQLAVGGSLACFQR